MGRVTINSHLGEAEYEITLQTDTRRLDQRKADLTAKIADAELNDMITSATSQRDALLVDLIDLQDELDDAMSGWSSAPAWAASTDYVLGDRVLVGVGASAKVVQAGRSGGTIPSFATGQGALTKENHIVWNTYFSATSLGHPSWLPNTNYTSGDNIFCDTVVGGSQYAEATTTGRSGPSEPKWRVDIDGEGNPVYPDFEDGGVWWRREDKLEQILEAAEDVIKKQAELGKMQLILDRLEARKRAYEQELEYLNNYSPAPIIENVWCTDYYTGLVLDDEADSSEVNSDRRDGLLIRAQRPPHWYLIDLINEHRDGLGLRTLRPDFRLYDAAQRHTDNIVKVTDDDFDDPTDLHVGLDGSTMHQRAAEAGFPVRLKDDGSGDYRTNNSGEILYASPISGHEAYYHAFNGWLGSPGHKSAIEDPKWTVLGIGYTYDPSTTYNHIHVVVFGYTERLSEDVLIADSSTPFEKGSNPLDHLVIGPLPGIHQPTIASSPGATFWNLAMLPGWQKWKPTYRVGTLTAIDRDNNTGTVSLNAALTPTGELLKGLQKHNLDINHEEYQPTMSAIFRYMTCDHKAFCVGDSVLIEFAGQDKDYPYIVGFESNPRPCAIRVKVFRDDGREIQPAADIWIDFTIETQIYNESTLQWETEYLGGGGYIGADHASPGFPEGVRQQVTWDSTNEHWVVDYIDYHALRGTKKVWLEVDMIASVGTQWPYNYKAADQYTEDNAINKLCEVLEMHVPYWETETTDEVRIWDLFNDCYVEKGIRVRSSVPYVANHNYTNTRPFYTHINATSYYHTPYVADSEVSDGIIRIIADGNEVLTSPLDGAVEEGTYQSSYHGSYTRGYLPPWREHVTKIAHTDHSLEHPYVEELDRYDLEGIEWAQSVWIHVQHELGISGIFVYSVQASTGADFDPDS